VRNLGAGTEAETEADPAGCETLAETAGARGEGTVGSPVADALLTPKASAARTEIPVPAATSSRCRQILSVEYPTGRLRFRFLTVELLLSRFLRKQEPLSLCLSFLIIELIRQAAYFLMRNLTRPS
jgi:hypothetical protein